MFVVECKTELNEQTCWQHRHAAEGDRWLLVAGLGHVEPTRERTLITGDR